MLYKNWCHSIDYNEVNKISGYILATKTLRTKRIVRMINHKTHIKRIDNTLYKRSYECKRRKCMDGYLSYEWTGTCI